jgi:glycosyltransferase involved in cell wall biosynthesis
MVKKIKILVDGHVFDGMFQGTRTYIKGLYCALADSEHLDIYMVAKDVENLKREFFGCDHMNFIEYKSSSSIHRLLFEIPKLVKEYDIDYAHYQYMDAPIKNCKTIVTIHDVLFLDFPDDFSWLYRQKKYLFKSAAKRANLLLTVSNYSKKRIAHHFDILEETIIVQKEAIDGSYFHPHGKSRSIEYIAKKFGVHQPILYISRIEPRKNHSLLLQAFMELRLHEKGYQLVFIGKQSIEDRELDLMRSCLSSQEKENLHHFERVDQNDLLHFLRAAEMFVYPTRAEGFGFPPLEAAAMQVQTLLSNATSLEEFTFFGERFFSPDDLGSLKQKMSQLLLNPDSFKSMKEIADTIKKNYDWNVSAKQLEQEIIQDHFKN